MRHHLTQSMTTPTLSNSYLKWSVSRSCLYSNLSGPQLTERTPSVSGQRHNVYEHDLRLLMAHVGVQLSYMQLRQIIRNPSEVMAAEDTCKSIVTRLDTVIEACHLYGGQCITVKAAALFSLGNHNRMCTQITIVTTYSYCMETGVG